eukprot:155179-Chlamydomonas_euryale.AAC.3
MHACMRPAGGAAEDPADAAAPHTRPLDPRAVVAVLQLDSRRTSLAQPRNHRTEDSTDGRHALPAPPPQRLARHDTSRACEHQQRGSKAVKRTRGGACRGGEKKGGGEEQRRREEEAARSSNGGG